MATVTAIPRLSKKGKQGRSAIGLRISDRFAFADRYVETLQKQGNIGRYRRLKATEDWALRRYLDMAPLQTLFHQPTFYKDLSHAH